MPPRPRPGCWRSWPKQPQWCRRRMVASGSKRRMGGYGHGAATVSRLPVAGGILSYFTRHRTAANLLLVLLIAAGIAAVAADAGAVLSRRDHRQRYRSASRWDGAGAEDVDRAIVQLLEPALLAVEGVESPTSVSREGRAAIDAGVRAGLGHGARRRRRAGRGRCDHRPCPRMPRTPQVRRGAWRDRVTDVVITGPVGVDQLGRFADEFVTRLFAAGVTRTTIRGVAAPETMVEVPSLVADRATTSPCARSPTPSPTRPRPTRRAMSTAPMRGCAPASPRRSAEEIAAIVLRSNPDGSKLTIGDVARVSGRRRRPRPRLFRRRATRRSRSASTAPTGATRSRSRRQVEEVAAAIWPRLCPRASRSI